MVSRRRLAVDYQPNEVGSPTFDDPKTLQLSWHAKGQSRCWLQPSLPGRTRLTN